MLVLAESDPRWARVREGLARKTLESLMRCTEYSSRELGDAAWLEMSPWLHGYPQPEDDYAFLGATYENVCTRCGWRDLQREPFRLHGEPRWGKRGIMSLFWVYDAIFVRPEVFAEVFAVNGYRCREVLSAGGKVLRTVVQVEVPGRVALDVSNQRGRICKSCNHRRHARSALKELPSLLEVPSHDVVLTVERFGEGLENCSAIVVSQRLRRLLGGAKVRGAELSVLRLSEAAEGT